MRPRGGGQCQPGDGVASGGDAEGDTLINIENLTGSGQSDTLEGNGGDNVLAGGAGKTRCPTSMLRLA